MTTREPDNGGARVEGELPSPRLGKHAAISVAVSAGTLAANVFTGVLIARELGPEGRGVLSVVLVLPLTFGLALSLGCSQAVSYHLARHPRDGARLTATWAAMLAVLALAAVGIGQALVSVLMAAQPSWAVELARIYLATAVIVLFTELAYGLLLGDGDYGFFNLAKLAQPVLTAAGFAVLWQAGEFSEESALVVAGTAGAAVAVVALTRLLRRHGLARPSRELARRTLGYGLRLHGGSLSGLLNARLDLMIIPAFLSASVVGLYAVALNVAAAVASLTVLLPQLLMPVAARDPKAGPRVVALSFQATVLIAALVSGLLAIFAGAAIEIVYGDEFDGSVLPLRILLVGTVFSVGANVLIAGLNALGRPLDGSLAYGASLVVTVVGLLVFLGPGGIDAAATVTSAAGLTVLVLALVFYRRASGMGMRELAAPGGGPGQLLWELRRRRRPRAATEGPGGR